MRRRATIAAIGFTVATTMIWLTAFSAHTGYVHINPEYWPAFAYSDGGYIQVHDCIAQDLAGAISAWNATGMTRYSATSSPQCSPEATSGVVVTQRASIGRCEGFSYAAAVVDVPNIVHPETWQAGDFAYITKFKILIPPECSHTSNVYVHEMGHANGLHDHYDHDASGNPTDCSQNTYNEMGTPVPTAMDCPGYANPQSHDTNDMNWLYRNPPFPPNPFTSQAQGFNRVRLTWTERSHNERVFRIERQNPDQGYFTFKAEAARDAQVYNDYGTSVRPQSRYCYRARGEGDYSNRGSWTSTSCATSRDTIATAGASFNWGGNPWTVAVCASGRSREAAQHPTRC